MNMRSTIDEEGIVMGWSGEKIAAIAFWVVLATVVVGLTAYSHKHDEPCTGIECVQPVMIDEVAP